VRNVSQSQFNSQSHLPPILKPGLGSSGQGRRSVELPPLQQAQPLPEQNAPVQESGEIQMPPAKPSGERAAKKPSKSRLKPKAKAQKAKAQKAKSKRTVEKLQGQPEPPPYLLSSGGNQAGAGSQSAADRSNGSKSIKVGGLQGQRQTSATALKSPKPIKPPKPSKPKFNLRANLLNPTAAQLKRLPRLTLPAVKLPAIPLPPVPAFMKAEQKPWEWSIVWLWALGAFGGLGIAAFAWMASLPPLPECRAVTRLSPGNQRLYCAQEQARSGQLPDLLAAMSLLNGWSEQEPLYDEVQRSISDWSNLVLIAARDQMAQNDLKGAIETANQIPPSSAVYPEAQETIADWQKQWQKGEQAYAAAQAAIQAQKWAEAADWASTLNELQQDYWRIAQADRLAQQIQAEKQGWQALTKARKMAQGRSISELAGAIGLMKDIVPETYVWQAAQADLNQWGQSLLDLAMRQWQQGDLNGAIAAAQQVPLNVPLPPEVQDLVKFSHAEKQVAQVSTDPSWQQIWNLMEGVAAMGQIASTSPLYEQAQAKQQTWEKQFQDGVQLRWATLGAKLGQQSTLNWAIDQTKPLIGQSSMTHQAQSLVATWEDQLQILEDQPILQTAETIAVRNTIPDLEQAIAYLRQIPPDRATWSETQRLTVQWQQQIQILEDRPIWDEAQALAKQERYSEAIVIAGRISSTRALYPQVQQAIESWKMAIRSAEMAADRKILDQAKLFAAKGNLTEAIATAAEISPGRDLYLEAQGAIGQWLKQRDGGFYSSEAEASDELF